VYGSWGTTGVRRGDEWAATARTTSNRTGATTRVTRTDEGGAVTRRGADGFVGTTGDNVFAGHDGNVYRKQGDSWQKYDNGSWNSLDRSAVGTTGTRDRIPDSGLPARPDSATVGQLNHDFNARQDGGQRARDASTVGGGGFGAGSGSFRPSGGGFRGGGFRGGGRR